MLIQRLLEALWGASITSRAVHGKQCRNMPGDHDWPSIESWGTLNSSVGGRLIKGQPLAQACYGASWNAGVCASLQDTYNFPEL